MTTPTPTDQCCPERRARLEAEIDATCGAMGYARMPAAQAQLRRRIELLQAELDAITPREETR